MAEMPTERPSWPSGPAQGYHPDNQTRLDHALPDQRPAHEVIAEMAGLLRDTRVNILVGGGILCAIAIGIALEAAFSTRALQPSVAGFINGILLCAALLCWLRAVTLLALAGRPLLNRLSEIRWGTGAPLDPRPRWLTLPPTGCNPEEWTWVRAQLLVGAARMARYRTHLADTWTYLAAAGFGVWTVVVFLGL